MAPYVDAISVNYNVDAADGWIAPYFFTGLRDLSGGKPVLITEWFYAAAENRSGNLNRTGAPHAEAQHRKEQAAMASIQAGTWDRKWVDEALKARGCEMGS